MPTDERETPTADKQPAPASQPGGSIVLFWIVAWLGTVAAGAVFPFVFMGLAGQGPGGGFLADVCMVLPLGAMIAGTFAIPIHVTIAILTWAFWLNRFRLATAAIAGALTGFIAAMCVLLYPSTGEAVIAGILGAIGSAAFGFLHIKLQAIKRPPSVASEKTVWQFTIRDLLVRMTVLAMLLSAWTCYFTVVRNVEEREQQRYREYQEESQQSADDAPRDETPPEASPGSTKPAQPASPRAVRRVEQRPGSV